jgi:hypothetical protein
MLPHSLLVCGVCHLSLALVASAAAASEICTPPVGTVVERRGTAPLGEPVGPAPVPLPSGLEIRRHFVTTGDGWNGATDVTGEIVYSNVDGSLAFPPGAGRLIADDVFTVAIGGCDISAYEILVSGNGDGTGPGFSVEFGIYDACPGYGGQLVLGTEGSLTLDDDGLHLITVDLAGAEVPMPSTFWIGVEFDRATAGWVMGTPATIGFTQDLYHHPFLACVARFGGSNLFAGFYVNVYCTGEFEREFLAYMNAELDAPRFDPGGGQWIADDVWLVVDDCTLSSLDVAVAGNAGPFAMTVELWQFCDPNTTIEGTTRTYQGRGDGSPELVRFDFPGGLDLNMSNPLWIAWRFDRSFTGSIISGEPALGFSEDLFCMPGYG